jgi:hypothetical protein
MPPLAPEQIAALRAAREKLAAALQAHRNQIAKLRDAFHDRWQLEQELAGLTGSGMLVSGQPERIAFLRRQQAALDESECGAGVDAVIQAAAVASQELFTARTAANLLLLKLQLEEVKIPGGPHALLATLDALLSPQP